MAAYVNHGVTPAAILRTVRNNAARSVTPFRATARELIELRGSAAKALSVRSVNEENGGAECAAKP